jgi:hypothetical protein
VRGRFLDRGAKGTKGKSRAPDLTLVSVKRRRGFRFQRPQPWADNKTIKTFVALIPAPETVGAASGHDATGQVSVIASFNRSLAGALAKRGSVAAFNAGLAGVQHPCRTSKRRQFGLKDQHRPFIIL